MGLLRMFLALAVFFSHEGYSGLHLLTGEAAVQAFFVVSGFYMALILRGKYAAAPLPVFYTNRLLRLAPTYWIVLLCSWAALRIFGAGAFVGPEAFDRAMAGPSAPVLAWCNLTTLGDELLFLFALDPESGRIFWTAGRDGFSGAFSYLLVPQSWSLSMELLFYLLAPLLVRLRPRALVALGLASFALRCVLLAATPGSDLLARKTFPAELWLFLLGILAWHLYAAHRDRPARDALAPAVIWLLLSAAAYLSGIPQPLRVPAFACFLAMAVPHLFLLSRDCRLDRFVGDLSYPVYIVHFLVLALLERLADMPATPEALGLTLAAALLLHLGLERPIDRWRQRRLDKTACGLRKDNLPAAAAA